MEDLRESRLSRAAQANTAYYGSLSPGLVPDSIIDRSDKKGLGVPVGRWLSGELRPWADELARSLARRGIEIRPTGERGEFDRTLLTAVSLELWFRTFIDGGARGPLN